MDPLSLVRFFRHACVCLEHEDVVVYVDPYLVPDEAHDADLIIITHAHGDHYSPEDIARVRKEDTCFASTPEVGRLLVRDFALDPDYFTAVAGASPEVVFECGAMVTPVAAENKNHPAGMGFGFVLSFGGFRYYFSGDTDTLDDDVRCDVLFCVCDGIWNMPDFARRVPAQIAAMSHRPGIVIPYHYGFNGVPAENGEELCEALRRADIPCRLLSKKRGF